MPGRSQPDPLWPPFPLAKRLNRNALTVAAALAGITVLTVVVVTGRRARQQMLRMGLQAQTDRIASAGSSAFLDQPPPRVTQQFAKQGSGWQRWVDRHNYQSTPRIC